MPLTVDLSRCIVDPEIVVRCAVGLGPGKGWAVVGNIPARCRECRCAWRHPEIHRATPWAISCTVPGLHPKSICIHT
jgi:hypothetical protein